MKVGGALFLDRDGVINRYRQGGVLTSDQFEYYENTPESFRRLGRIGWPLVVVTNQSAIGRGWTTVEEVEAIHQQLSRDATSWGASILAIELCPHLPDGGCSCRKPATGLFEKVAVAIGVDLRASLMIGDSPSDIEAAQRLGMRSIRVLTGRGEEPLGSGINTDHVAGDLLEAVRWIETTREPIPGDLP